MSAPEIAVAIASHERPLRLRWLLEALVEQTLDRARWEVVVCHDSTDPAVERLLSEHALARAGMLSHHRVGSGAGSPGRQRNIAWRAARAPLIAFTDDDCRPPPQWLARALASARARPGAIVQGATSPDPDEVGLLTASAHARTQRVHPPVHWAQACNIVYPRRVLEWLAGFDERLLAGEDADLALRARELGAAYCSAPEVLTYHAVQARSLLRALKDSWRWGDLAGVAKRHPGLRRRLYAGLFWKSRHAWLMVATGGLALAPRCPSAALLALPWAWCARPPYGRSLRGLARTLVELPGQAAIDTAEVAALAAGSIRHRTLVL